MNGLQEYAVTLCCEGLPPHSDALDPLAARIKSLRRSRHWTQKQLAQVSGIEQPLLSAYETGSKKPGRVNAIKRAHAYGQSLDELLAPVPGASPSPLAEPSIDRDEILFAIAEIRGQFQSSVKALADIERAVRGADATQSGEQTPAASPATTRRSRGRRSAAR
jgi:transcriptional regulator with XRE-family HTH domain